MHGCVKLREGKTVRGYYVLKAKTELEKLIKYLCNKFNLSRLEAIRQLQDALNDLEQEEVLKLPE